MTTIAVDTSLLVDGQNADAPDVLTPIQDLKTAVENTLNGVQAFDQIKMAAATTLIITSGVINITNSYHNVDTEGAAASDELVTINGGSAGDILFLSTVSDARDVVVKNGTGNIHINSGADVTLTSSNKLLILVCTGSNWTVIDSAPVASFNPHSPGAIGDVTPGSGAFTTLSASGATALNGASTIADANFGAATTGGASVNIAEGVAPTTPASGDIWHDSTQKTLVAYVDGIKQSPTGVIFTNSAALSVPNNTSENTTIPTGIGTVTLPANFLKPGKTLRILMMGNYTTTATNPNITWRIKLGSTTIATCTLSSATFASKTNFHWHVEIYLTCYTTGVSGTVRASGIANALNVAVQFINSAAAVTVDTTVSQAIDLTHQLSSANMTTVTTNFVVEVLN